MGIDDIRWGVAAARKGGLSAEHCLNTLDIMAFDSWKNK
jgi:DNA polymerase (family 10)